MGNKPDKRLFKILAIGWTGAILLATLSPSDGIPLFDIPIPNFDKWVHFGLFVLYAVFVGLSQDLNRGLLYASILGIGLGLFTEWMQGYVPGRQTDIMDAFSDFTGTIIGLATVYVFRTRFSGT